MRLYSSIFRLPELLVALLAKCTSKITKRSLNRRDDDDSKDAKPV